MYMYLICVCILGKIGREGRGREGESDVSKMEAIQKGGSFLVSEEV